MNTPAHVAASLLVWRKVPSWKAMATVTVGAVLPDAPMFGFYAYQKLIAGRTERDIWSTLYFDDAWQWFFDVFNSIPLMLVVIAVSHAYRYRLGVLLGASALLHVCCDLPFHHDDAHRHFLPLSNWRFVSPVSYWDPQHFGDIFMWLELGFAIGACLSVIWKDGQPPMRYAAMATLTLYAAAIVFAMIMWSS